MKQKLCVIFLMYKTCPDDVMVVTIPGWLLRLVSNLIKKDKFELASRTSTGL